MRALIQRLKLNSDEVAVHGSYFSYKDPILLKNEIRELEQILNEKVIGTRQHNLNLETPRTWEYQLSAGLKYDTTLGFRDTIGYRWGTSCPFFPNTVQGPLPILEIPLIIMDICVESKSNKIIDCFRIADDIERYKGVLTLLWHPPIFNALEYPGMRDIYVKINQYCIEKGAWIARARDIYCWHSLRNRNTFAWDYNPATKTCTIVLEPADQDHFLTLYLPPHSECIIQSGNAEIIKKEEDCAYIKTYNLQGNNEVILGIS
jgi:hypothetical protein